MKRVNAPVDVKTREESPLPALLRWNGKTLDVQRVLEVWRKETKWWRPQGPERRDYYRCVVKATSGRRGGHRVVELYRRHSHSDGATWVLARQID